MTVRTKLAGFAVLLLVVFGAAFAVGDVVGPIGDGGEGPPAHQQDHDPSPHLPDGDQDHDDPEGHDG